MVSGNVSRYCCSCTACNSFKYAAGCDCYACWNRRVKRFFIVRWVIREVGGESTAQLSSRSTGTGRGYERSAVDSAVD